MRIAFEKNPQRFHVAIEDLPINERSRDDIPRLLSGLTVLPSAAEIAAAHSGHRTGARGIRLNA